MSNPKKSKVSTKEDKTDFPVNNQANLNLKYLLLNGTNHIEFDNLVSSAIGEGWECQGGVSVTAYMTKSGQAFMYCQAMVKRG